MPLGAAAEPFIAVECAFAATHEGLVALVRRAACMYGTLQICSPLPFVVCPQRAPCVTACWVLWGHKRAESTSRALYAGARKTNTSIRKGQRPWLSAAARPQQALAMMREHAHEE